MPGVEQVLGECKFYDYEKQWPVAEARLSACDNESDSDGIHHGELVV